MNIELKENERIDDLQNNGLKIIQNPKGFCFGIDAVLLSHFTKVKKNGIVVEFGTGTGIIPILLSAKTQMSKAYVFEVQEEVADMARRSFRLNHLEDKIELIEDNLRHIKSHFSQGYADVVVTNPPYFKSQGAIVNPTAYKAISRHEILCNLEDIIQSAAYVLKQHGQLYMIHRPDRIVDILTLLRQYKIEPKELRMIQPYANKRPNIMLIKGTKNGNAELKFHDPLIVYEDSGAYSQEIFDIYNESHMTVFEGHKGK